MSARSIDRRPGIVRLILGLAILVILILPATAQRPRPSNLTLEVEGRGKIVIELFVGKAPKTTARIIELAKQGFYDGQRFHKAVRTPRPFLVQIGAPGSRTRSMDDDFLNSEGTGTRIPFEDTGKKNDEIGMVGLSTLKGDRDSGDCQFYILLGPASFLDGSYTVFGKVSEGMSVLKQIQKGDRLIRATIEAR